MTDFCTALKKALDKAPEGAKDPIQLLYDQHCYGFETQEIGDNEEQIPPAPPPTPTPTPTPTPK
jgi:hypothetical protein